MQFDIFQTESKELPDSDIEELPCKDAKITLGKGKKFGDWYWSDKLNSCYHFEIEINTLDDLLSLSDECGQIIIDNKNKTIEVYNAYH